MLKRYIRLNRNELYLSGLLLTGIFLSIHLIIALVLYNIDEHSSPLLSSIMLSFAGFIFLVVLTTIAIIVHFDLVVSLGCTRRRALALVLGRMCASGLVLTLLTWLYIFLERTLAPRLWMFITGTVQLEMTPSVLPEGSPSPSQILFVDDFGLPWWLVPLIFLLALAVGLMCGAVLHRFGRRGGQVLFVLYMLCVIILPNTHWEVFPHVSLIGLVAALVILVCLGLIWAVLHLLHGPINR